MTPPSLSGLPAALALLLLLPAAVAAQQGYSPGPAAGGAATPAPAAVEPGTRHFHIVTVHLDGNANTRGDAAHPAEAFPAAVPPAGGGLLLRPPAPDGAWSVRAFVFHPSQVVVRQGDRVALTFVGVHGPSHRIAVDGREEVLTLRRGETATVTFTADRPGAGGFRSLDRMPSMAGEVLVLPR